MNKLPVEILHRIFLQLHQQDKLQCMTVCSHWKFVIKKYSLFHTIRISRTKQLNKLIKEVRQDPTQGQKLERLILDVQLEFNFKFNILFQLFPNVRSFTTFHIIKDTCFGITAKERHYTWDNIEQIEEHASHSLTQYLLKQSTCIHLTKIIMAGFEYQPGKDMICRLSSAPSLKYLAMTKFVLTLQDFELLHENAPLLRSLSFRNGMIDCDTRPSETKPTAFITTLEMKMMSLRNADHEMKLLQYFGAKYPNIVELVYEFLKMEGIRAGSDEYLEYKEQVTAFINGIGSKLKRLSIRLNNEGLNVFQILDDTGCMIRNITLNGLIKQSTVIELSNSNQARHIKQLTIDKLVESVPFRCLYNFTVLKDLNIFHATHVERPGKDFDKCLISEVFANINPQLESLLISGADVELNHSYFKGRPLRKLSFINCKIPSYVDSFISGGFPLLHTLIFDSCKFKDKSLVLHKTSLIYFKVVCNFPKSRNDIIVIAVDSNERRRYWSRPSYFNHPFDKNDPFFYPAVVSTPDNISYAPYMSFVFNSVHTCFVMNSIY